MILIKIQLVKVIDILTIIIIIIGKISVNKIQISNCYLNCFHSRSVMVKNNLYGCFSDTCIGIYYVFCI